MGHHPDCARFDNHRLLIGGKSWCSGCLGLMAGAVASAALAIFYLFSVDSIRGSGSLALLVVGFCLVSMAFAEASFRRRVSAAHLSTNSLMIVGFFSLAVAMTNVGGLVPGLIAVAFSYLWIDTRIELSLWRHRQVCSRCPQACKRY